MSSAALEIQDIPALEVVSLAKSFGTLKVLKNISFSLERGSFHALLGGNGAGKSTLVKCIMGYYHADEGAILLDDHERKISSTHDAHRHGLGMVYQHFTLVPDMTVLENLVLSLDPIPKVVDWTEQERRLTTLIENTPFKIPLNTKVNNLSAGQKQKVEIVKQLFLERKILILDEPTSVLTPQEADEILGMLKALTETTDLSVFIITHKFREVINFADTVSVLRLGELTYSGPLANKTPAMLADLMIGNETIASTGEREVIESGELRLEVSDLFASNDSGTIAINDVSFKVNAGEILGIAGVSGNGQRELVEVLSGQIKADSGEIKVCDQVYTATRTEMAEYKFHCLPEEPLRNASVSGMNLIQNIALRTFDTAAFTRGRWFIKNKQLKEQAIDLIERYNVRPPRPENAIENLSGGNVQRLVLAREISGDLNLLVVANPCFGLDFAATAEIRSQLMKARNRGVAILLVSEDLDELLELSDRIAVIFEGALSYESAISDIDVDEIGMKMAGH